MFPMQNQFSPVWLLNQSDIVSFSHLRILSLIVDSHIHTSRAFTRRFLHSLVYLGQNSVNVEYHYECSSQNMESGKVEVNKSEAGNEMQSRAKTNTLTITDKCWSCGKCQEYKYPCMHACNGLPMEMGTIGISNNFAISCA